MGRILDIDDGFTSATDPNVTGAPSSGYVSYASDAAYEADNGAAQNGDAYYNTTDNKVRIYENGAWVENASFDP